MRFVTIENDNTCKRGALETVSLWHSWSERTREQHCRARGTERATIGRFCWNVNSGLSKIPWNHTLHGPNTTRVRVEAKTI